MMLRLINRLQGKMMRLKLFAVFAVMLVGILPALSQNARELSTISFNGYGFSYGDNLPISNLNVNITRYPGDPSDALMPGGPQAANTRFDLFTDPLTPDPEYNVWTDVTIRFYSTDAVGYRPTVLQTLLKDRPVLTSVTSNTGNNSLPFQVSVQGIPAINARPQYIETASFTGIRYITYLTLSVDPLYEDSYLYTFQGISNDGSTYVSMVAPLQTLAVPDMTAYDAFALETNSDKFNAGYEAYLAEAANMVDEATPDQFTPNLDHLDAFVETITVK